MLAHNPTRGRRLKWPEGCLTQRLQDGHTESWHRVSLNGGAVDLSWRLTNWHREAARGSTPFPLGLPGQRIGCTHLLVLSERPTHLSATLRPPSKMCPAFPVDGSVRTVNFLEDPISPQAPLEPFAVNPTLEWIVETEVKSSLLYFVQGCIGCNFSILH